jgi:hypothetical protein
MIRNLPEPWQPRPVPKDARGTDGHDTRHQGAKDEDLPAPYHAAAKRLAGVLAEAPEAAWPELVDLAWPIARAAQRSRRALCA